MDCSMHNTGHSRHWLLTSTPPPPREAGWMCGCGACVPCSVCILHSAPGNYCLHSIGRWRAGKGRSQRREALDRADAKRAKNTRDKGHGTHTARPVMIRVATACNPTREQGRGEARGPLCLEAAWPGSIDVGVASPVRAPFLSPLSCNRPTEPACDREVPVAVEQTNRNIVAGFPLSSLFSSRRSPPCPRALLSLPPSHLAALIQRPPDAETTAMARP